MLLWMGAHNADYAALRNQFQTLKQWPFSTERKFMATLGRSENGETFHVKGAPDIVLLRCQNQQTASGIEPLTDAQRATILDAIADCSARGMRTLAFAVKNGANVTPDDDLLETAQSLTWLGFVAIADPVRPEVAAAVEKCRIAGIEVKIVTGDNPYTASEIGRQIGLFGEGATAARRAHGPARRCPTT